MLRVTPFYVYRVSNPSTGFRIRVGVFESRGTVLYGVRVFYSLVRYMFTKAILVIFIVISIVHALSIGSKLSIC